MERKKLNLNATVLPRHLFDTGIGANSRSGRNVLSADLVRRSQWLLATLLRLMTDLLVVKRARSPDRCAELTVDSTDA
jgi:hypothetical protein